MKAYDQDEEFIFEPDRSMPINKPIMTNNSAREQTFISCLITVI